MRRAGARCTRLMRRLALDRNELRRTSDRIEGWCTLALIIAFVPLAVLSASAAVSLVHAGLVKQQREPLRQVTATLVQAAPAGQGVPGSAVFWAAARWTVGGSTHLGAVQVVPGTRAGATVQIWVDAAGNVQPAPPTAAQVTGRVLLVEVTTPLGVALGLWLAWYALRLVLDRRRLTSWAEDWSSFGTSRTR